MMMIALFEIMVGCLSLGSRFGTHFCDERGRVRYECEQMRSSSMGRAVPLIDLENQVG